MRVRFPHHILGRARVHRARSQPLAVVRSAPWLSILLDLRRRPRTRKVPTATPDHEPPKMISPSDPSSAWTAKTNKRVQFGYGLNYLIDVEHAIIVDVEATPARTYDEVASTKTMIERTEQRLNLKPDWLAADTAYDKLLAWLLGKSITAHIPVWERYPSLDGMLSRSEFTYDAEATSKSVAVASSCEPRDRSMMAASGTTCHNLKTVALARSSNDVRAHHSRRSRATLTKMRATMPGHLRAHLSSSDRAMRERK